MLTPPLRIVSRASRAGLVPVAFAIALAGLGCSAETDSAVDEEPATEEENAVKVDTRTPEGRAQYDANVAFANAYVARCKLPATGKKRAIVTGFGRFMGIANNATGRMAAGLLPGMEYPETSQPPPGAVDPPGPQLSVAAGAVTLPRSGDVELCVMVLPVYWDLAAILLAKEIEAFGPDLVLMNGVAGARQDLWLELGAVNKAAALDDGSDQLRPATSAGASSAPILESATSADQARANLLSWSAVESAARAARDEAAQRSDASGAFGDVLRGVKRAGFPRGSNTYLCNNITYITGYLMDYPGRTVQLLRSNTRVSGKPSYVKTRISRDTRKTPRVFAHWPSELATRHTGAGRDVMRALLDAQLSTNEAPTRGRNTDAAPDLAGGGTF
ncbi:MAG: hypothetical protein IPF92_27125 [Myxococcales bacterium]|nr:hypothetical protein [Myxococcales bacterium]HQY61334.1 hypothetical protein [Polyangiaceae bacterium]